MEMKSFISFNLFYLKNIFFVANAIISPFNTQKMRIKYFSTAMFFLKNPYPGGI
jgi:hypothetical protein